MIRSSLVFALILAVAYSCTFIRNDLPLIDQQPKLVKEVPNGQKFIIGDPSNPKDNYLYIANLKGTHEQMGKAFGQMFADQMYNMLDLFYNYYGGQLKQILAKKLPGFLVKPLTGDVMHLLKKILDLNYRITKSYTNPRYYQQIKGMAEGAGKKGVTKDIQRLNLFPQLVKARCTVAGLWKTATLNGQTLHVRALDWDSENPISKYPIVVVYHPSDPKLHKHANFGWAGFVGSMTGVSEYLSLGEKIWIPAKNSVKTTRYGNPWTYMFRDILYDAHDIKSALNILTNTHRTCAIHIGLGSATDHSFRMFEYAQNVVNNYDDQNYTHYTSNHPKKAGVAYFDKHVQPSGDSCLGSLFTSGDHYGHWDAESLFRYIGPTHQTGDTQLAVFDLENKLAYVAYASPDGKTKGYFRNPIKVDLGKLFAPF